MTKTQLQRHKGWQVHTPQHTQLLPTIPRKEHTHPHFARSASLQAHKPCRMRQSAQLCKGRHPLQRELGWSSADREKGRATTCGTAGRRRAKVCGKREGRQGAKHGKNKEGERHKMRRREGSGGKVRLSGMNRLASVHGLRSQRTAWLDRDT